VARERSVDPALSQALDSVRDAVRAEEKALKAFPLEHAKLQRRHARLQAEREKLVEELEALRRGQPPNTPRLPKELVPPFRVHSQGTLRRALHKRLGLVIPVVVGVGMGWLTATALSRFLLTTLLCLGVAGLGLMAWWARRHWMLGERFIESHLPFGPPLPVSYTQVVDAVASATPEQRRLGIGAVVVKYRTRFKGDEEQELRLDDVPEPVRLADWIRERRQQ
jgi:hypothetical protein